MQNRLRLWVALVAAIVLATVAVVVGFVSIAVIFSTQGGNVAGGIALAVAAIAVFAACVRWAAHSEHRLRGQPAAGAGTPAGVGALDTALRSPHTAPSSASQRRRAAYAGPYSPRLYHHRHGPVSTAMGGVIIFLAAILLVIGTIVDFGNWQKSRFVQAHGDQRSATVQYVDNIVTHGRYSDSYSADISVALAAPVGRSSTTTVHYPDWSSLSDGDQVTVLVDPDDPGYAELPGHPDATVGSWIALLVLAVIFAPLAFLYWYELIAGRIQRRRRARTAGPALTSARRAD